MIAEILTAAGYKVGRFSSPHLHSYQERFTINGQQIEAGALWSLLVEVQDQISFLLQQGEEHPTEFEVLTAAAFLYFAREKVDLAVMEVGMGGTYDSTNVITPLVSVITSVDFDHTAYLGANLAEIAANKAGIIKPGVPLVAGLLTEEAEQVISGRARILNSAYYPSSAVTIDRTGPPSLEGQQVYIRGLGWDLSGTSFALLGDYQLRNLAVALTAIKLLQERGYEVTDDQVREALGRLVMPGRLEIVCREPLVILDAAHNPHGARALHESLELLRPGLNKVVVVGLLDDKERKGILEPLGLHTRAIVVTRPAGTRASQWLDVLKTWQEIYPGKPGAACEDIATAVQTGLGLLEESEYLLITGSFYVLDQARQVFLKN